MSGQVRQQDPPLQLTSWSCSLVFGVVCAWWLLPSSALCQEPVVDPPVQVCPAPEEVLAAISQAGSHYVRRQYTELADVLAPVLGPDDCIQDVERKVEAHLLMGVAELELGDAGLAELDFLALLRIEPDYQADGQIFVSPAVIAFFEEVRRKYQDELDEIRALRGGGEGVVVEQIYIMIEEEQNQFWVNFLPFGAGQFQNDQPEWGIAFASAELLSLGVNALGAFMVEQVRGETFTFTRAELERARDWQNVQIAGAVAFGIFYAAGVAHGMVYYEDVGGRRVLPPTREKPRELGDARDSAWRWAVAPAAGPDGGGVAVTVTF